MLGACACDRDGVRRVSGWFVPGHGRANSSSKRGSKGQLSVIETSRSWADASERMLQGT